MTVGAGAVIFGCAGPRLLPEERAFFRDADPFGFIVFARNVEDPDQLRRLTADLREAVGRDAPVLVDQEGGRVQRLRSPHWREWTPPLDTVDGAGSLEAAERIMWLRSAVIGAELRDVGIDANCIPTLDVVRPATHPFLMNRCYGRSPEVVTRIGRAVADGLIAGGVLPVMKHMPGHGLSHVDTHHDLPTVDVSHEALTAVDFAPFKALRDLPMAMTAHLVFAALDGERPATQSPVMIRVIRDEIGFQGLLMSDDLNMQALAGTLADRTARTIAAGVDIALHCKGDMAEMVAVAGAAGRMGPAARARAEAAVAARRPATVDLAAALAELAHG
jgi:beta-N-acetylhexosaminidase